MNIKKKFILLFTFTFVVTSTIFAQDVSTDKKKEVKVKAKTKVVKQSDPLNIDAKKGFENAYKNSQSKYKKVAEKRSLNNKGIITPEMLSHQRLKKNLEGRSLNIPMVDRDIGVFTTKSANINIQSSDFGTIDGDVVSIYKNGKLIVSNHVLKRSIKVFTIPLTKGFNKIEIVAQDEGTLRPNTGNFTIFDDLKTTFISDFWYLAKGAKIHAMIIRE